MSKPELHIVPPVSAQQQPSVDPDKRLRSLFKSEARLERQLLHVRREIGTERARYAAKHKLGCFPAIDHLRRLFS